MHLRRTPPRKSASTPLNDLMNTAPLLELEVYVPKLREKDYLLQLQQQLNFLPKLRYKVDVAHEVVYFEADDVSGLTQRSIAGLFEGIGLHPRFVGDASEKLPLE